MELTGLIIAVVIIVVIFLIMHFVLKTMKLVVGVVIIVIVLGVWFYGFSGFFDKVSDVKESIPELGIQKVARSITGCTADEECVYVVNPGECRMIEEYCNNIIKEENYQRVFDEEVFEEDCNRTAVEFNFTVGCGCKMHKEREGKIKQWLSKKVEEKAGYTYCWKNG